MNKYKIKVSHVFSEILDVEAANEEEAKEKALVKLKSEEHKAAPNYETTIPPEHWPVITEEKYNEMLENSKKEKSNIITA